MQFFQLKSIFLLAISLLALRAAHSEVFPLFSTEVRSNEVAEFEDYAYSSKVRIYNRTDFKVKVYVNGYYVGNVWGDHNRYFSIYPGANRVTVYWPSGYYEYFDFSVCHGCVHKIWTSDYDG